MVNRSRFKGIRALLTKSGDYTKYAHGMRFIALFSSQARKLGSVADDEAAVSTAASSVSHTHADIGAIWVQTAFLEALGHSPPYIRPVPPSESQPETR